MVYPSNSSHLSSLFLSHSISSFLFLYHSFFTSSLVFSPYLTPCLSSLFFLHSLSQESVVFSISEFSSDSFRREIPAVVSTVVGMSLKSVHSGYYQCLAINKHGHALQQPPYHLVVMRGTTLSGFVFASYKFLSSFHWYLVFPVDVVDHCAGRQCLNGATCVNTSSTYLCQCTDSWTGITCDTREPSCLDLSIHPVTSLNNAVDSVDCMIQRNGGSVSLSFLVQGLFTRHKTQSGLNMHWSSISWNLFESMLMQISWVHIAVLSFPWDSTVLPLQPQAKPSWFRSSPLLEVD